MPLARARHRHDEQRREHDQQRAVSRRGDPPQVPRQILLRHELADDLAAAIDEEDLRDRQAAPLRQHAAAAVVDARIRDPVLLAATPRVAGEVLRVDADELDPVAVASCAPPRAASTRGCTERTTTPRSRARSASCRAATRGRCARGRRAASGRTPARSAARRRRAPATRPCSLSLRHAPDEQREQCRDERDCQRLRRQPGRARHQAETMKTVVPTSTWLNSHSASRDVHPDAPVRGGVADRARRTACRGSRRPGPRGPSSACRADCPGPGGIGSCPCAQGELGGYHHGFLHLTTTAKRPSGVGYATLSRRDARRGA